jgi:cyclase
VVNTHFHWDHWQGNEVYSGAEIVTNEITKEAMLRTGVKRIQDQIRTAPAEIARIKADLAAATTPAQRAELQHDLRQAEDYLAEMKALRPALPSLTFENTMRIFKGDREIELLYLGRSHTEGDVFVFLPREKVVVTGDAVVAWAPFMADGYPEDWVQTLRKLEKLDFTQMIMGHGDMAGKDWLRFFTSYIEDLIVAVRREAVAGATLEEIKQRVPNQLASKYEPGFSKDPTYPPWSRLVLLSIERVYATGG